MLEKTCILDGFSKTYSMTGWRLGYGVMPLWLADAVSKLMVNSNSCTASFTQKAGLAALTGPQNDVDHMVSEFRKRRDAIVKGLNSIPGFHCLSPAGAFYAFPSVKGTGISSKELADLSIERGGSGLFERKRFRHAWRWLHSIQLREFAGKHSGGHRTHSQSVAPLGQVAGQVTSEHTTPTTLRAADFLRSAANELSSASRAVLVYGVQPSDVMSRFQLSDGMKSRSQGLPSRLSL